MTRDDWDALAPTYDHEADHGLADPTTRAAWRAVLREGMPSAPARVADLGCGTGSLTALLTEDGHVVDGVDLSPAMLAQARRKVPGARLVLGDVAEPPLETGAYDVVLSRHVLWAMPSPAQALERWIALLAPGGRLVLVEGSWETGAGLTARECERLVRATGRDAEVRHLPDPVLWGKEIRDERYLLVS